MVAKARARPHFPWGRLIKKLLISSLVGLLVLCANFPTLATQAVKAQVDPGILQYALLLPVSRVQGSLNLLVGPAPLPFFHDLMATNFVALWLFLLMLAAVALRHWNLRLLGYGMSGFILGFVVLHLVSWLVVIGFTVISTVFAAIGWVSSKLYGAAAFVFTHGWWLLLIVGLGAAAYIFREELAKNLAKISAASVGVAVVGYILYALVPPIWRWFLQVLDPVQEFLKMLWVRYFIPVLQFAWSALSSVLYLLLVLLIVFAVLASLGRLFIDQVRAAWISGLGKKEACLGTFAIGTALALVMLASVAAPGVAGGVDFGWQQSLTTLDGFMNTHALSGLLGDIRPIAFFAATMPAAVERFVFAFMTNSQAPVVDGFILLSVIAIAIAGLTRGIFFSLTDRSTRISDFFIPMEVFGIIFGLIGGVLQVFVQATTETD